MTLLLVYLIFAQGVSFLCSLVEATMLSVTHAYVEVVRKKHPTSGKVLKDLKDRIDRPLIAILTLNTIANTAGAMVVAAQVLKVYTRVYGQSHTGAVVAVASGLFTLSILVFSEIIPKTIGAVYWKRLAPTAAYIVKTMILICYPLVVAMEAVSKLIAYHRAQLKFTREEMIAAAEIGRNEGAILKQEMHIIQNLMRLTKICVKDVLTPRSVILALQKDMTVAGAVEKHTPIRFSRIPVYGRDLDDIVGVAHRYKLLRVYSEGNGQTSLHELAVPIHAVADTTSMANVLDQFIRRKEHIFLVVDEYGGTEGIITLEDAVETLLGVEIMDEFDTVGDMRALAEKIAHWRKKKRRI